MRSRPIASSCPSRRVSNVFGTAARLSNVTALSCSIPCSGPTGTQVGMSRMARVTGATITLLSMGRAGNGRQKRLQGHGVLFGRLVEAQPVDAVQEAVDQKVLDSVPCKVRDKLA